MKPRISVVIPAFNEANYLGKTLRSLQQQTYRDFEVVVVDNNSTDQTAALARSFGARVVFEPKPGVCAARQAGTLAARGAIIVSTDADTVFPQRWLDRIAEEFAGSKDVVAVTGPINYINAPAWGQLWVRGLFGTIRLVGRWLGRPFYISACNTAFLKEAWQGYNVELTQGGDELGLLRQLKQRGRVVLIDNPVNTSSRRLKRGFWYNFILSVLVYYLGNYFYSRLTGRSLFRYVAVREDRARMILRRTGVVAAMAAVMFGVLPHAAAARSIPHAAKSFYENRIEPHTWR